MVRPTKGGHDVPPALAKRAAELVKAAKAHRVAEAKAALQDALAAHEQTVRQMFRLGTALTVLAQPGMAKDAGYASGFYPMCETVFGMGRSTVDALTKAVKAMGETRYAALKPARANALLELAAATEADDTEAIVAEEKVPLWSGGPRIDLKSAATKDIRVAAKQVRDHRAGAAHGPRRGRTASPEERALVETVAAKLAKRGIGGTVKVRATRPGAPSVFDVLGLAADDLRRLAGR